MNDLALRLAGVRDSSGLSTRGFAAALTEVGYSVSHTSVGSYENGTGVPAAYVAAVADHFGVNPRWLLTGEGIPGAVEPHQAEATLREVAELVQRATSPTPSVQRRLDAFFRLSPDPFVIVTQRGSMVRWNPAFQTLTGRGSEELDEAPLWLLVHEDDRERARARLSGMAAGGEHTTCELRLLGASGEVREVECAAALDGSFVYLVIRDVTDARRAATELDTSRSRLAAVFGLAQEAMLLADDEARCVDANPSATTLTGYGRDELLGGMTVADLTPGAERATFRGQWRNFIETGRMEGTYPIRRKDGTLVDTEFRAVANIQPGLHLFVLRLVPGAKERAQARKLAAAVVHSGDCVVITDRAGWIEYVNPAFERVTGYALEDVRGRTLRILRSGRHDAAFYEELWAALLRGEVWRGVIINRRKNGELFKDHRTIAPILDEHGAITHFVSTGRDLGPVED